MSLSNIREKVKENKIKLYQLDKFIWKEVFREERGKWKDAAMEASKIRLEYIEEKLGIKLENVRRFYVDVSREVDGRVTLGIENQIGGAVIPLGIAGPLEIRGSYAKGRFFIPIATNEAALIAGLNRGIKAINLSDGVSAKVLGNCMTRAPLIETPSLEDASTLVEEVKNKGEIYKEMVRAAERYSRVSKVLNIQPFQLGKHVWLRFVFETGDSMGMNSATKYSAEAVKVLTERYPNLRLIALSGNLCADKKASHVNVLYGRGKTVETEAIISREVLSKIYASKGRTVTPEAIVKINFLKNYVASSYAGTLTGFNANVANTVAAIFAATGQDLAQVVESSSAFTYAEVTERGDLYFSLTLPSLEVGTIGGGTGFGTAKEALEIIGCAGSGKNPGENALKFAEIVASAITAQELNLLGTLGQRYELAESHIKLARGI